MLTLTNILAGLSLILALASGGLWGRSYWVYDVFSNPGDMITDRGCDIESTRGRIWFQAIAPAGHSPIPRDLRWYTGDARDVELTVPMFDFAHFQDIRGNVATIIAFPHWFLLLALAILPALRGWQLLRSARRRSENLCPQCGYDLRATPQRCPECGHETEQKEGT
jgi:hypothetical protein